MKNITNHKKKQKNHVFEKLSKTPNSICTPPVLRRGFEIIRKSKYAKNMKIEETKSRLEQLLERFHYFNIFENMVFVLLLVGRACFQK